MAISTVGLDQAQTDRAIRHVAALMQSTIVGTAPLYRVEVPVGAADPKTVLELGDQMPQVDPTIKLTVAAAPQSPSGVQVEFQAPLYYFTTALGFDRAALNSFETTLSATIDAYRTGGRVPSFPAPGQPPAL